MRPQCDQHGLPKWRVADIAFQTFIVLAGVVGVGAISFLVADHHVAAIWTFYAVIVLAIVAIGAYVQRHLWETESKAEIASGLNLLNVTVVLIGAVALVPVFIRWNQSAVAELKQQTKSTAGPQTIPSVQLPEGRKHNENLTPEDTFVKKYVVAGPRSSGAPELWTVLIIDGTAGGSRNFPELNSVTAELLREERYNVAQLFRASLVEDRAYGELFAADPAVLRQVASFCDGIVLGKVTTTQQENTLPEDVVTQRMSVDITIVDTKSASIPDQFTIAENGAGFSAEEALAQAEARLAMALRPRLRGTLSGLRARAR